jgi:hypothetical protein
MSPLVGHFERPRILAKSGIGLLNIKISSRVHFSNVVSPDEVPSCIGTILESVSTLHINPTEMIINTVSRTDP